MRGERKTHGAPNLAKYVCWMKTYSSKFRNKAVYLCVLHSLREQGSFGFSVYEGI